MVFSTKGLYPLTYKNILKQVSEFDLWKYYLNQDIQLNSTIKLPYKEDKKPSGCLFKAYDGSILLKDFAGDCYTIFKYLKKIYSWSYQEVLDNIDNDFQLGYKEHRTPKTHKKKGSIGNVMKEENKSSIIIYPKKYNSEELNYWKQYFITKKTLDFFNVLSLEAFCLIKKTDAFTYYSKITNPIFCYVFEKDTFKIYRPLASNYRFITNASDQILQGEDQLPHIADYLIITKALKDVMVLHELGMHAAAVQSENSSITHEKMKQLLHRFNKIYVIFDNDVPGQKGAQKLSAKHNVYNIKLPMESKDISDYVKIHGLDETKKLLDTCIQ